MYYKSLKINSSVNSKLTLSVSIKVCSHCVIASCHFSLNFGVSTRAPCGLIFTLRPSGVDLESLKLLWCSAALWLSIRCLTNLSFSFFRISSVLFSWPSCPVMGASRLPVVSVGRQKYWVLCSRVTSSSSSRFPQSELMFCLFAIGGQDYWAGWSLVFTVLYTLSRGQCGGVKLTCWLVFHKVCGSV